MAYVGPLQLLTTLSLHLTEPVRHMVDSSQYTDLKAPVIGTGDAGSPTTAEQNVAIVAADNCTTPPSPETTSESTTMEDSDGNCQAIAQAGPSAETKPKQVGTIKPVPWTL